MRSLWDYTYRQARRQFFSCTAATISLVRRCTVCSCILRSSGPASPRSYTSTQRPLTTLVSVPATIRTGAGLSHAGSGCGIRVSSSHPRDRSFAGERDIGTFVQLSDYADIPANWPEMEKGPDFAHPFVAHGESPKAAFQLQNVRNDIARPLFGLFASEEKADQTRAR